MKRIDTTTKAADLFGVGKHGFKDGNRAQGIEATVLDAAWFNHVQEEIARVIEAAGIALDPADHGQLAKAVVKLGGQDFKASCRAATTGNIVLTGLQTIDGVALAAGDRVLVKNQATGSENGIWIVAAGAWTRAPDADEGSELSPGAIVAVEAGTQHGNSLWMVGTDGVVTIGTTALTFERVGADGSPVGSIILHSGPTAPAGYLVAAGQAVARTTYPQLDAAMYVGDANNATAPAYYHCTDPANPTGTRNTGGSYLVLPDYRGEFLRGLDNGRGVDAGRSINSWQADELKAHTHSYDRFSAGANTAAATGTAYGNITNTTGSTGGSETRPRNVAVLVCIKAFSVAANQGLIDITALANECSLKVPYTAFTGSNQQFAVTGYQRLPGGLIIQWVRASPNSAVTFPIAFPSAVFGVTCSAAGTGNFSSGGAYAWAENVSLTGFTYKQANYNVSSVSGGDVNLCIAIGY